MEQYPEFHVSDYVRLMMDFLSGAVDASRYCQAFFDANSKRIVVPDGEPDRIVQQAFGDCDDYDIDVDLEGTIDEHELRRRVERSLAELRALGYGVDQGT